MYGIIDNINVTMELKSNLKRNEKKDKSQLMKSGERSSKSRRIDMQWIDFAVRKTAGEKKRILLMVF